MIKRPGTKDNQQLKSDEMRGNRLEGRIERLQAHLKPKQLRIIDIIRSFPENSRREFETVKSAAEALVQKTPQSLDALSLLLNFSPEEAAQWAKKHRQEIAHRLMYLLMTESSCNAPNWSIVDVDLDLASIHVDSLGHLRTDPIFLGLYHELIQHGTAANIAMETARFCAEDFRRRAQQSVRCLDATAENLREQVLRAWPRDEDTEEALDLIRKDSARLSIASDEPHPSQDFGDEV